MRNSPKPKFERAPTGVQSHKRVFVSFFPQERAECEADAREHGMSMSAHVRAVYLDGLTYRRLLATAGNGAPCKEA